MSIVSALHLSRRTGVGFAIIGLCWGTVAALVPVLKVQIGASDALFGSLLLASAFGLLTANWLAPLADRRIGRVALPAAGIGLAMSFPVLGLIHSPVAYGAVLLVLGVFSGLTDVLINARVSEIEARERRPLMNVNHGIFSVAYALAAIAGGIGREAGLAPVVILAMPAALSVVLAMGLRLPPDPVDSDGGAEGSPGLPLGVVTVAGLIVLVAFGTEAAVESWSALHIERTLGGGAAEGALGPAMLGFTMAIGRFGGQVVSERWPDSVVIRAAACLATAGVALGAMAPTPLVAYLGFGIAGLGVSVIGPLGIALAGRIVTPALRTQAIARAAVLGFCGFFVVPPFIGVMSEIGGLRVAFGCVAVFALLILPLETWVRGKARHA